MDRDHETEPDAHLRRGDGHHREREDLAGSVAGVPRERDQRKVRAVQHDLERKQDDQRVAPDEYAQRSDAEEQCGDTEVPGDRRAEHQLTDASSCWLRRVCEPRITPPTAAMSRTIDVISNASR